MLLGELRTIVQSSGGIICAKGNVAMPFTTDCGSWMHPLCHALGASEQGDMMRREQVYRDDLD